MILYIFLITCLGVSLYVNFNMLNKVEFLEAEIENASDEYDALIITLTRIQEKISLSNKRLEEIDSKESFKSDDEVGYFFEELKKIQDDLNKVL